MIAVDDAFFNDLEKQMDEQDGMVDCPLCGKMLISSGSYISELSCENCNLSYDFVCQAVDLFVFDAKNTIKYRLTWEKGYAGCFVFDELNHEIDNSIVNIDMSLSLDIKIDDLEKIILLSR